MSHSQRVGIRGQLVGVRSFFTLSSRVQTQAGEQVPFLAKNLTNVIIPSLRTRRGKETARKVGLGLRKPKGCFRVCLCKL